ncbi:MNIO family bufferin maturase [Agarivorans sp. QJM3NY_33]|uniref:MNIO family bufferin maturase n=1 Tax=Agarivorans sp. QJM3NY_33 TaxID=3421432 RepID=UPI003D7E84BE
MTKKQYGLGLRSDFATQLLAKHPNIDWLEIHAENYFNPHSYDYHQLTQIAEHTPISVHGVGLSLGSSDALSIAHLSKLKTLIDHIQPFIISEHLSWSSINGRYYNDLLPLPYTEECLKVFVDHVNQAQDFLGRQLLIENPSAYLAYAESHIPEPEFLNQLVAQTGCGLLLDINNVYVSAYNLGWNYQQYLEHLNLNAVQEIHLAGYTEKQFDGKTVLIDSHNQAVHQPVWDLYQYFQQHFTNQIPVLIEWDSDFPALEVLCQEMDRARAIDQLVTEVACA